MAERVKVYEETKKGIPVWAWLLPLLLLLALLAYFLTHRHPADGAPVVSSTAAAPAFPDLGSVHFDTDKATLTPEGQATLQQAAAAMKANPSAHLRIEGFTDSTGSAPHNADLSEQRALAVAGYLKEQGIDGSRLTGGGFGAQKPTDTNATPNGKADNRRVELFSQPQ
ncbi:OmpA family protein [Granulicella arctica]|uniref:OmpA family protein n=1 Tax=Granulicella arctica TaxID=940613 RepID=UPI0021DFAF31|nr:OmpA family protein [Granulicella arctica]